MSKQPTRLFTHTKKKKINKKKTSLNVIFPMTYSDLDIQYFIVECVWCIGIPTVPLLFKRYLYRNEQNKLFLRSNVFPCLYCVYGCC